MRWFSRRLRIATSPRVAITVVAGTATGAAQAQLDLQWRNAFTLLDSRKLPATWAVVSHCARWPLADELVASRVPHELAFDHHHTELQPLVPAFLNHATLARRVQLQLRTLVSSTDGVHPSLLNRLAVTTLVPTAPASRSRTGSLRGVAWNVWEAPVTDDTAATLPQGLARGELLRRLDFALRESVRMHLLVKLAPESHSAAIAAMEPFLDRVADFHRRGWLEVETVGTAAQVLQHTTRMAA